ncbi:MAG: hypothetical protein EPO16_08970 [Dehalococcoidia bacterium]|nr:MAG: hypothetical protein EPO16_08970 [Dehalococcoidia bacterium]
MIVIAVLLGTAAALVQAGPLAALGVGGAAVALPAALAAGWAAVRGPREGLAAVFAAAVVLGVLSEVRVGLYALVLLPAAASGTLAGMRAPGLRMRAIRAAGAGLLGAMAYVGLLVAMAGGRSGDATLGWGLATSAFVAATTCVALFPLRPRGGRLFT